MSFGVQTFPCLVLLGALGCRGAPRAPGVSAHPLQPPCPEGLVPIPGGQGELGDADPDPRLSTIPLVRLQVAPFCIDDYPFPGQAGDRYFPDGLAFHDLTEWEALLDSYGLRLCSAAELLWASAMGPANLTYATGQRPGELCEPNIIVDTAAPMGLFPACVNEWGLHDFNVYSSWGTASPDIDEAMNGGMRSPWVVVGGTNRDDTYYSPDNYGIHSHGLDDEPYADDQLRVCSDPGVWGEPAEWQVFRQAAANQGTYAGALAWYLRFGPGATTAEAFTADAL